MSLLTIAPLGVYADNLLNGWHPENALSDNAAAFYDSDWLCLNGDGNTLDAENGPASIFSELVKPSNFGIYYQGKYESLVGTFADSQADTPAVALVYPSTERNLSYSLPIDVPHEAKTKYTLQGYWSYFNTDGESTAGTGNPVQARMGLLVFTFGSEPGGKTIVFDNKEGLYATDSDGRRVTCTARMMSSVLEDSQFSLDVELDKNDKYITIYGPYKHNVIGNLSLLKEGETPSTLVETICDEYSEDEAYDMSGRRVPGGISAANPGIYIVKSEGSVKKIMKKQ